MTAVRPGAVPGRAALRRIAELETFVREHRRIPWRKTPGQEQTLRVWIDDVLIGRRAAGPEVRARLDVVLRDTPHVRRPYTRTAPPPSGQSLIGFADANGRRTIEAGARNAAAAAQLLQRREVTGADRVVLQARVDRPRASLSELAAVTSMTRDQYASRLRRLLTARR